MTRWRSLAAARLLAAMLLPALIAGCNQSGRPGGSGIPPAAPRAAAPPAPASTELAAQEGGYTVIPGDTVYGVANRFQVPIRDLIDLNRLQPPYRLTPGQQLLLPRQREHVVAAGDTLYGISRRYGIDVSTLIRLNNIQPPYTIAPGQSLLLPSAVAAQGTAGGTVVAEAPAGAPAPAPAPAPSSSVTVMELPPLDTTGTGATPAQPPAPSGAPAAPEIAATPPPAPPPAAVPQPGPLTGGKFQWPVNGKIVSAFGPREGGLHNDGINIAAPIGTPVRAAENGVVAYAGNELRGFGNMLLIRHADGWMSAYAHADTLLVKRGDKVVRGQTIARVGQTGNVSSPQLHFELRRGAEAVDPTEYLGAQGAALPPSPAGSDPGASPGGISPAGGRDGQPGLG